jgi:hypothetical protein
MHAHWPRTEGVSADTFPRPATTAGPHDRRFMTMRQQRAKYRFIPRVEVCEARDCPSVNAYVNGGAVIVNGDNASNTVNITYANGLVTAGITGSSGSSSVTASNVSVISVMTRGGNDNVTFTANGVITSTLTLNVDLGHGSDNTNNVNNLTVDVSGGSSAPNLAIGVLGGAGRDNATVNVGSLTGTNLIVTGAMGAGNDSFATHLTGTMTNNADAFIQSFGGLGDDALSFNASAGDTLNMDPNTRLTVTDDGGLGNDTINTNYAGTMNGSVAMTEFGDAGFDTVNANVGAAAGSNGQLALVASGGLGNDNLTVKVAPPPTFSAQLYGNAGSDTATETSNVQSTGVEHNTVIPPSESGI